MLWLLFVFALAFAFLNGYRDSSSILAGVIASKALPPRPALALAGLAEFAAPFLFGIAVAKTLTTGLVDPNAVTTPTILAAMASALLWTLFAWYTGVPSSSSHALIGGLLGAAFTVGGYKALMIGGIIKVVLPLFFAPIIGMGVGFIIMHLILFLARNATPRVNRLFQRLQIFTLVGLALSHSANDAQKSMGIITLGLLLEGSQKTFQVPIFVVTLCAAAIAAGASTGDWRLMRTLGRKIYLIRPVDALASQSASACVVMAAALIGIPVSTSQVISMALLGAGAAERVNKVRWQVGEEMLITWALTMPVTMLLAAFLIWAGNGAHSMILLLLGR